MVCSNEWVWLGWRVNRGGGKGGGVLCLNWLRFIQYTLRYYVEVNRISSNFHLKIFLIFQLYILE